MRIVVLVKYVPEPTASWHFADDFTLDRDEIAGCLSPLDEYPIEQALRLIEAGVDAEISFLTMGPARAAEALRKALSLGGDRAVHVTDGGLRGSDALATSLVLATALRQMGFDLVLTGMASTDAEMSVVGTMVAARLQVPVIAGAVGLQVTGDTVTVRRESDEATEEVVAELPAVVSITDRSGEARYPSFKAIVAAKKKPVTTWSLADLGIAPDQVGAGAANTIVRTVRPRPARVAGTVITDEGDGAVALADFLTTSKLL
jgi:electron transfer flavoprotein beta subunit